MKAKDILNYELKDGKGEYGGIPYEGYTLDDYLWEISINDKEHEKYLNMDIKEINKFIEKVSGIAKIKV